MHKLVRPEVPDSLKKLKAQYPSTDEWSKVTSEQREEIRDALFSMQGHFCAYCERCVTPEYGHEDKTGHIEHFRRRSVIPALTFEWNNIFYSCSTKNTCGKQKDSLKSDTVDYTKLIDPCIDNPEDYLFFNSNGDVSPRENLLPADKERAEETIRVFGLQSVREDRASVFKQYKYFSERPELIDQILDTIDASQPFVTMLYSVFGRRRVA